jgi:microcin C transport system substrate-binding protein
VEFEAFKTNAYDFRREVSARRWATEYEFPAVADGRVKTMQIKSIEPISVQPIYLNLRRPLFQDQRVRQALNYAFDFEALNANLFYDQYVRLRSYWQGSPLEATGLPTDAELELLEPLRGQVPLEVFTNEFKQPTTDGSGEARENLLIARDLLSAAGWELRDGQLTNKTDGSVFKFELLIRSPTSERIFLPYTQNLKRLGIEATLRLVDTSQYINRLNEFDFDVVYLVFPHNDLTPGPEQYEKWGSQSADIPGSSNLSGVKDPAVDALIGKIVSAETYEGVITATRALDRVLTWNFYQPLTFTSAVERYAYWTKLKMPDVIPALGFGKMGEFSTGLGESSIALWWYDETQVSQLDAVNTMTAGKQDDEGWGFFLGAIIVIGAAAIGIAIIRQRRIKA